MAERHLVRKLTFILAPIAVIVIVAAVLVAWVLPAMARSECLAKKFAKDRIACCVELGSMACCEGDDGLKTGECQRLKQRILQRLLDEEDADHVIELP